MKRTLFFLLTLSLVYSCKGGPEGAEGPETSLNSSVRENGDSDKSIQDDGLEFSLSFIEDLSDDLDKVSRVIEDMENFEPLSLELKPVSYRSNFRIGQLYTEDNNAKIKLYKYYKKDTTYSLDEITINISAAKTESKRSILLPGKLKKIAYTKNTDLYVIDRSNKVHLVKDGATTEIGLITGNKWSISKSSNSLCLRNKSNNDIHFIKNENIYKQVGTELGKLYCTDQGLLSLSSGQAVSFGEVISKFKLNNCQKYKYAIRNSNIYYRCHSSRNWFSIKDSESTVKLPKSLIAEHNKYKIKLESHDRDEDSGFNLIVFHKIDKLSSKINIEDQLSPNQIRFNYSKENYYFLGQKNAYIFDNNFNFIREQILPYKPLVYMGNKFVNNRLNTFSLGVNFDYESYIWNKNYLKERFLDGLNSKSKITHFSVSADRDRSILLKSNKNIFQLSKNKDELIPLEEITKGQRVSFKNGRYLTYKYDKNTKEYIINTKDHKLVKIPSERGNKFLSQTDNNVILTNGRALEFYSIENNELSTKITIKHHKRITVLDNNSVLGISENKLFIYTPEKDVNYIADLPISQKQIASFELVDNKVVIYNKDKSIYIHKIPWDLLYLEEEA